MMDFSAYRNDALGPIQYDEAVFLYGIALTVAPRCVLEFGVLNGHSTRVWLESGADVIGIDIEVRDTARELEKQYPGKLRLIEMDMRGILAGGMRDDIDIVFWDAGHDFTANAEAFQAVEHLDCFHIVHDTGTWSRHNAPELALSWFEPGKDTHVHRPDEGVFCKYIAAKGYQRIDFHTTRKFRHGITILKKPL